MNEQSHLKSEGYSTLGSRLLTKACSRAVFICEMMNLFFLRTVLGLTYTTVMSHDVKINPELAKNKYESRAWNRPT